MKKANYLVAAFILGATLLSAVAGISLLYPFGAGLGLYIALLSRQGGVRMPLGIAWGSMYQCRWMFVFILLIGANISVWMSAGIVPAIMYYGFEYLAEANFLFLAFIITGVMSIFMGTAVGTISTLGLALLGIGQGFGIPSGLLMGVLVSGAFLADKLSPISGLLNLTMEMTETGYRQVLGQMARTLLPVIVIAGGVFYIWGLHYAPQHSQLVLEYQQGIQASYRITPLLLVLPLGVVLLPLTGIKTMPTVLLGLAGGMALTVAVQGTSFLTTLNYVLWGYQVDSPSAALNSILTSGGIWGMVELALIVLAIIALSGLLEHAGVLDPLLHRPLAAVKRRGQLLFRTGIISVLITAMTCDQTAGIVLQGRSYRDKYRTMGVDDAVLARTISDTGTIVAPLLPWNVNALIVGLATGVTALEYAPYALICLLFPLTTAWIWATERRPRIVTEKKL